MMTTAALPAPAATVSVPATVAVNVTHAHSAATTVAIPVKVTGTPGMRMDKNQDQDQNQNQNQNQKRPATADSTVATMETVQGSISSSTSGADADGENNENYVTNDVDDANTCNSNSNSNSNSTVESEDTDGVDDDDDANINNSNNAIPNSNARTGPSENSDEGLLRTILEELELERAKRIQLEIKLSELPKEGRRGGQHNHKEGQGQGQGGQQQGSAKYYYDRDPQQQSGCDDDDDDDDDDNDNNHIDVDDATNLFNSQNHALYITHVINSIFIKNEGKSSNNNSTKTSTRTSISKRALPPILTALFSKLFQNTIVEICGIKHDPIDEKARSTRIKDAIYKVTTQCDGSIAKRLMRTEYTEGVLKPILLQVGSDFVMNLIRDMMFVKTSGAGAGAGSGNNSGARSRTKSSGSTGSYNSNSTSRSKLSQKDNENSNIIGNSNSNSNSNSNTHAHGNTANNQSHNNPMQMQMNQHNQHEEEIHQLKTQQTHALRKLTTERDGYLTLIDALTISSSTGTDAISLSSKRAPGTLPLHIVRFLEVMPWDERCQDYISTLESVCQWQAFDTRIGCWSDKRMMGVSTFKQLPLLKLGMDDTGNSYNNGIISNAFELFAGNSSSGNGNGSGSGTVVTNQACSHILDLTNGFPLPHQGTWEWVGNWCLGGVNAPVRQGVVGMEEEGWTYADSLHALLPNDGNNSSSGSNSGNGNSASASSNGTQDRAVSTSRFRKRTWQRRRVLISYPACSQRSKQMLSMNAHNAKLTLALSKLHNQVHDMQNSLIQKDEECEQIKAKLNNKIVETERDLENKQRMVHKLKSDKREREKQIAIVKIANLRNNGSDSVSSSPTKLNENTKENGSELNSVKPKSNNSQKPKSDKNDGDVKQNLATPLKEAKVTDATTRIPLLSLEEKPESKQDMDVGIDTKSQDANMITPVKDRSLVSNQSNSPPSLSFLFGSSSTEKKKPAPSLTSAVKYAKSADTKAPSATFTFLFNKDKDSSKDNGSETLNRVSSSAPKAVITPKISNSKIIDDDMTRFVRGSETILATVRSNVQSVVTSVETISEKARDRVNSIGN